MSTQFYLVRHGIKEKGIHDVALAPEGVRQAQKTAIFLCTRPIRKIVSSPLLRAKQTAQLIAEAIGAPVTENIRLRERANWGDLPGQTFEQFVEMWERCTRDRDFIPPVGDSARKAGERMASCLQELAAEHPQDSLIIVTHGGLITDFLVNVFTEEQLNERHPDFVDEQSQLIPECSITNVVYQDGIFHFARLADVAHLL
ncbi:Putative phosphoserine phosphatase 2 [Paenibacillus konkukensis]|uniref:Phosphoserine phosphatase 2 n=1 Tax=Paenibacillus konkukensis TaxID=2020716 RepID=A0ABY4RG28_9BACL|nr:histidine phosphatase family protein [Paenibacillus konkukensis]UQZ81342.1 Putative phosphoserine phosphatase 2 [Paenibacillus konkukensis]